MTKLVQIQPLVTQHPSKDFSNQRSYLEFYAFSQLSYDYLEAEGLFPPVRIFLNLFLCAGYFFNASD